MLNRFRQHVFALSIGGLILRPISCDAQIVIGVSAPVTGSFALFGREISVGTKLAVEDINAKGGVLGKKLEYVLKDDRCDPAEGARHARELIEKDKVVALVGYPCSGVALAALRVAAETNRLLISVAAAAVLTDTKSQVFLRMIGRPDKQGTMVGDLVNVQFKEKKIAVLLGQDAAFDDNLKRTLQKYNIKAEFVVSPENIPANSDIVVTGPTLSYRNTVNEIASRYPRSQVVVPTSVVGRRLSLVLGDNSNYVIVTNPAPSLGGPDLENRAQQEGVDPKGYLVYAYAMVQVFAEAAKRAPAAVEVAAGKALFEAARKEPITTALGSLSFDEKGDVKDWRFELALLRPDRTFSMNNVCRSPQCRQYEQCPPDCPNY